MTPAPPARRTTKPFVLLATRAEDVPADEEYAAFLRFGGLAPDDLIRVRLEAGPMPDLDLDAISGIIVGGSPFTGSDPDEKKSPTQRRVEREFAPLLDAVIERDTPFLGACYGVGTLGSHLGATIDTTYGEPVGVVPVRVTDAGAGDPLLAAGPPMFHAFVGHKEAMRDLPDAAVLLASSPACPVQMFRVRENIYATQFHPELDLDGIRTRIRAYAEFGYFAPDALAENLAAAETAPVTEPMRIIERFVSRYAR